MSSDPDIHSDIDSADLAGIEPERGVDPVERVQARKRTHAALFGDSQGPSASPVRVDRYELIRKAGSGGLGTVWKAYDPKLDREVAIKLLRSDKLRAGQRARAQLLAEAAVMARLTHPNVVRVYDVGEAEVDLGLSGIGVPGSGRTDTQLYVTMEFVDGHTLRHWQRQQQRSLAELVEVYSQAAAGLLAAHEAELVHGDFKPDNVLIDARGRVLVTDFAVTRNIVRERVEYELSTLESPTESERNNKVRQSIAAVLIGTPAYMAPEQLDGEIPDARSDQFGFCVALWEAVTGERPFTGRTFAALREAIAVGPPALQASLRLRPARLRRVLARGLAEDPRQRYPDLQALLAELERACGPSARRRVRAWAIGLATLVAAAGALVVVPQLRTVEPSAETASADEPPAQLAASLPSCAAETERVVAALRANGDANGEATEAGDSSSVEAALDAWRDRWALALTTACEGARAKILDDATHAQREACLERRLQQFEIVHGLLSTSDKAALAEAGEVLVALPEIDACEDPSKAARVLAEPPLADADQRQAFADARSSLERAEYLQLLREYDDALSLVEPVASLSESLGWDAGRARALLLRGSIRHALDQREAGSADLVQATLAARRAGRPELEAEGLLELALDCLAAGELDETERWIELAATAIEAADDTRQRVGLTVARGRLAERHGDHDAARQAFARALELAGLELALGEELGAEQITAALRDANALDRATRRRCLDASRSLVVDHVGAQQDPAAIPGHR